MADHFIPVPGGSNNHNYANVDLIVELAESTGADAVWAGWGHASENPRLPDQLASKGIVFIGPPGSAMRALGDKISSTIVAQSAQVPTMGWSGDGIITTARTPEGYVDVPHELYMKACVSNVEEAIEVATRVGYPLMIKASEGGGGKGIRKVTDPMQFRNAFTQVSSEVPGSPIFLMRLAENARHLEVQILADCYGNAISLFGRDCSVQRRHQKIIEEAPVTIAEDSIFEDMEMSAVRLAKLVGYVNAGTLEFLYDRTTHKYYFLELNPRLQVEHPTTEIVSGVNIPAAQLQVAMGIPLHRIPHIRLLYGLQPNGNSMIDFHFENPESVHSQRKPQPTGHVIACRITAENPDAGFKPSGGQLVELNFRSSTDVWGYFSVSASGGLHEYADSQFGHIFAYGPDRLQSRRNMIMALKELRIRGDFRTTVEYLIKLLGTDEFANNDFTTAWLDSLIEQNVQAERPERWVSVVTGAAVRAFAAAQKQQVEFQTSVEKGQTSAVSSLSHSFPVSFILDSIKYEIMVTLAAQDVLVLRLNGSIVAVRARHLSDGGVLVTYNEKSYVVYAADEPGLGATRLTVNGRTVVLEQEVDPTILRSPSPGKLMRWVKAEGEIVRAGQIYAEIEVMKMIMPLIASESGRIRGPCKQPGISLSAGAILGHLELDDMTQVKKAILCTSVFPPVSSAAAPVISKNSLESHGKLNGQKAPKSHQLYLDLKTTMENAMNGFEQVADMTSLLDKFVEVHYCNDLPFLHTNQVMSSFHGRLPSVVETKIVELLSDSTVPFPDKELLEALSLVLDQNLVLPLVQVVEMYQHGADALVISSLTSLLQQYLNVEKQFVHSDLASVTVQEARVIRELKNTLDADALYWMAFSHARIAWKSKFADAILKKISELRRILSKAPNSANLFNVLHDLVEMGSAQRAHIQVQLCARSVLTTLQLPDFDERYKSIESVLVPASTALSKITSSGPYNAPESDSLRELVDSSFSIFDVLPAFFHDYEMDLAHSPISKELRLTALTTYIRRAYNTYKVYAIKHHPEICVPTIEWHFQFPYHNVGIGSAKGEALRAVSVSDMTLMVKRGDLGPVRVGVMVALDDVSQLKTYFNSFENVFRKLSPEEIGMEEPWNVLNVSISSTETNDVILSASLEKSLEPFKTKLQARGIRRVTFVVYRIANYPRYFTFRERFNYAEDMTIRHIEPSHAFQLELHRLADFHLRHVGSPTNKSIHVYHATGKNNSADSRFFVRALVRPGKLTTNLSTVEYLTSQADSLLVDTLNVLELAVAANPPTDCNHLFLNFIPQLPVTPEQVQETFSGFIMRHGSRLWKLRITNAEVRFQCTISEKESPVPYRFFISNVSGVIKAESYREMKDAKGRILLSTVGTSHPSGKGELHLCPADDPYPTKEKVQPKRYRAHVMGTTYAYDYVDLFRAAVSQQWSHHPHLTRPKSIMDAQELVLDEQGQLRRVQRPLGTNSCGMVGWLVTMNTPECPDGRQIIVIANDITYAIGSFGPAEDDFFFAASKLSREMGIPRIYISANSGARIGLAEEVLSSYRISWNDEDDKTKGYQYLYLTVEDHERLKDSVKCEPVEDKVTGEVHMKIIDIIGIKNGLGVENLMGSGLIAGETSAAYDEVMTITLVACRSVGIGAYLVRLGQRSIQCEGQPIILTGAAALNKVLGREVYTSNLQLGGVQIMHRNGVSHLTCVDPLHGVHQIVQWLSYVPAKRGDPLPVLKMPLAPVTPSDALSEISSKSPSAGLSLKDELQTAQFDATDREIQFEVTKQPYDPQHMLHGHINEETGDWVHGFFDKGSWMETMDGWSRTVVVGRGRLGGVPVGAIAVETRQVEAIVPADPANPASSEQKLMEPPGVWTPQSAYKTAQAIKDLGREGLPLIIFANWRGFSGGQRDMYDAILKYGSYIVDALRNYPCPAFVYIVPHGELRGGAWVVLDPSIHPDFGMEMYADKTARGGVIEPSGLVEIKYRKPQLIATIDRLDKQCCEWKSILDSEMPTEYPELDAEQLQRQLTQRQELLLPIFHQAAVSFADLHDTPGRMKAKGAIRAVLEWKTARKFFYWRIRRRVAEDRLRKRLRNANPDMSRLEISKLILSWISTDVGFELPMPTSDYEAAWQSLPDTKSAIWLEQCMDANNKQVFPLIRERIDALEVAHLSALVAKILKEKPQAAIAGFATALLPGAPGSNAPDSSMGSTLTTLGQLVSALSPTRAPSSSL
jgi:acetyl-CoA carboxylase/biotin carboxylase 1